MQKYLVNLASSGNQCLLILVALISFAPDSRSNESAENLPTVIVALGMQQGAVIKNSSFPIAFNFPQFDEGEPATAISSNALFTANVNFYIVAPYSLTIENVRYWNVSSQYHVVYLFSGDAEPRSINEVFVLTQSWTERIDQSGWIRARDKDDFMFAGYPHRSVYNHLDEVKRDFLRRDNGKINLARVGYWEDEVTNQFLALNIIHRTESGLPRKPYMPLPVNPLTESAYTLRFTVSYR